jgi:GMP synthase (glutamine-hydrolysing)
VKPEQKEFIAVLDFGSQYAQLIARRVRENGVYSVIHPCTVSAAQLRQEGPAGLILSGGPASTLQEGSPRPDPGIFDLGIPVLGICYGLQVAALAFGGRVIHAPAREYGRTSLRVRDHADLFAGLGEDLTVWMSHGDRVEGLSGVESLATTENCPVAAVRIPGAKFYGVQFHPEVTHTPEGSRILHNFLFRVCGCRGEWKMSSFIEASRKQIAGATGGHGVLLGLSGGVDSTVAAVLLHSAVGDRLTCLFVDNGLLRKDEAPRVRELFTDHFKIPLVFVDASDRFLDRLRDVSDPEEKRKIIGHEFIAVFEDAARDLEGVKFLAQGTLYPDVIESVSAHGGPTARIKSHHNVGGLPDVLNLDLVEPFRYLFKDEVRQIGRELGVPHAFIRRHPFPGPGLGVRVLGPVSRPRLDLLREADAILIEELEISGLYESVGQAFVVLLPVAAVGVMGDERSYENVAAVRVVDTRDFMTADWARLPHDFLGHVASRIINEVRGINRVVYDISSKPPATIEWE